MTWLWVLSAFVVGVLIGGGAGLSLVAFHLRRHMRPEERETVRAVLTRRSPRP